MPLGKVEGLSLSSLSVGSDWGFGNVCALAFDGTAYCYTAHDDEDSAGNSEVNLSLGEWRYGPPYFDATPSSETFVSIDTDGDVACGIDESGRVTCWGNRYHTDLLPFSANVEGVVRVVIGVTDADEEGPACTIDNLGTIRCFGNYIENVPSDEFMDMCMSEAGNFACGITIEGNLECWSTDASLGGELAGFLSGTLSGLDRVVCGGDWICTLADDGEAECDPTGMTQTPYPTPGLLYSDIEGSASEVCGMDLNGDLRCWAGRIDAPYTYDLYNDGLPLPFAVGDNDVCVLHAGSDGDFEANGSDIRCTHGSY